MSHQEETSNEVVRYMGEATSYYDHLARYVTTSTIRDVHIWCTWSRLHFIRTGLVFREIIVLTPMHNVAYGNTF